MLFLGCHLSISGGYLHMGEEALSIGANTFQYFSRNPRGGNARAFDASDAQALVDFMREHDFGPALTHAPYTLNPCAAAESTLEFARRALKEDLQRLDFFPNGLYNLHPGCRVGQELDAALDKVAHSLDGAMFDGMKAAVLLETMAGKGSEVGRTFEELRSILDGVALDEKMGVCLDTCHVWDGGYDIVNDLDGVLTQFDKTVGLSRLRAVHINDSMNPLGAHKDRHAKIGEGHIGFEAFRRIINHPALRELPFILETPNDDAGWAREIAMLREAYEG